MKTDVTHFVEKTWANGVVQTKSTIDEVPCRKSPFDSKQFQFLQSVQNCSPKEHNMLQFDTASKIRVEMMGLPVRVSMAVV
eukprot:1489433-Amphidinium_carterae.1